MRNGSIGVRAAVHLSPDLRGAAMEIHGRWCALGTIAFTKTDCKFERSTISNQQLIRICMIIFMFQYHCIDVIYQYISFIYGVVCSEWWMVLTHAHASTCTTSHDDSKSKCNWTFICFLHSIC